MKHIKKINIMKQYIDKSALVAEIEKRINKEIQSCATDSILGYSQGCVDSMRNVLSFLDTLEAIDPYEQCIQYDSIKAGIQAHAETYSFNIESELFNQLTKDQQELWRKEIEQAVISGGEAGVELARDPRYKENIKEKEVDLDKKIDNIWNPRFNLGWDEKSLLSMNHEGFTTIAKHFYELGLKSKGK